MRFIGFKVSIGALLLVLNFAASANSKDSLIVKKAFSTWEPGFLDIHHVNTGEGNCTFIHMPDGTSVLIDAGTVDKAVFETRNAPLKATASIPDTVMSVGKRIGFYLRQMDERIRNTNVLDYIIVTHFHSDHYGAVPEILTEMNVGTLIDRGYPDYSFPLDLRKELDKDPLFTNYLAKIENGKTPIEKLIVGSRNQVHMQLNPDAYPTCYLHNIKSNAALWNGKSGKVIELFTADDMLDFYDGGYNENPLSMAFKLHYGDFDYYLGADNTGLQDGVLPTWFDVESPISKAVGKVDAMVLDHHGNRDANNKAFIETLDPQVAIQQVYSSDQPGQEVYYRLRTLGKAETRKLYATNMHSETLITYGPWFQKGYESMQGHVVIRVYPGGKDYQVFVLDERDLHVRQTSEIFHAD